MKHNNSNRALRHVILLTAVLLLLHTAKSMVPPYAMLSDNGLNHERQSYGYGVMTDGRNWLDLGGDPWTRPDGGYTLELWLQTEKNQNAVVMGNLYPLSLYDVANSRPQSGFGFLLEENRGGQEPSVVFIANAPDGGIKSQIPLGQWVHIAGTFNGEEAIFYVNGNRVGSMSSSLEPTNPHHTNLSIGGHDGVGSFSGMVAEVRFWDRARSSEEIQASWESTVDPSLQGLVGYWVMRWEADHHVKDETGHNHNAALSGSPLPMIMGVCEMPAYGNSSWCVPSKEWTEGGSKRKRDPLPDLVLDANALRNSLYLERRSFPAGDCAVDEGCVSGPGTHLLLRFDTVTGNIGQADVRMGSPTNSGEFVWHECHQHYHWDGFARYFLYDANNQVIATGAKQSFCLMDTSPMGGIAGTAAGPRYTCSYQGISVGWADVYSADLDCQWIDVSNVRSGLYYIYVEINPLHRLAESNYANNQYIIPVRLNL